MLKVNKHIFLADFYHFPFIFLLYFFQYVRERKLFVTKRQKSFLLQFVSGCLILIPKMPGLIIPARSISKFSKIPRTAKRRVVNQGLLTTMP